MTQVTKSTMIGELLQIDENIAPILLNIGMHCLGCPSSQMETIEEAAMVHGIEPDALVKEINDSHFREKHSKRIAKMSSFSRSFLISARICNPGKYSLPFIMLQASAMLFLL